VPRTGSAGARGIGERRLQHRGRARLQGCVSTEPGCSDPPSCCGRASRARCLRRWLVGAYYMLVTILSVGCEALRQWHGQNPLPAAWAAAAALHAHRCPAPRLPPPPASAREAATCCLCVFFNMAAGAGLPPAGAVAVSG
jgi:hypothetical protein